MKTKPWDEVRKEHFTPEQIRRLDAEIEAKLNEMPDKVIDETSARFFRRKAQIAVLDANFTITGVKGPYGSPYESYAKAEVKFENPVFVISEDGETIGTAVLALEGRKLVAEFILNENTPEVFELQQGIKKFYPHIVGGQEGEDHGDRFTVKTLTISGLALLNDPPMDLRSQAL